MTKSFYYVQHIENLSNLKRRIGKGAGGWRTSQRKISSVSIDIKWTIKIFIVVFFSLLCVYSIFIVFVAESKFLGRKFIGWKSVSRSFCFAVNDEASMNITFDKNLSIVWRFFLNNKTSRNHFFLSLPLGVCVCVCTMLSFIADAFAAINSSK